MKTSNKPSDFMDRVRGRAFGRRVFGRCRGLWEWCCAALLSWSCTSSTSSSSDPETGGETHFLTLCDEDSACGGGLECVCDTCTLSCDQQAACGAFAAAQCVASNIVENSCVETVTRYCDVRCATDSDCAVVSRAHRCEGGSCRSGLLDTRSDAGGCARGEVSANELLIIGDSFFAAGHQVTAYLEDLARTSGALTAGERYRDESRLVDNGLALMGNGIEDQYAGAVAEAEVEVVVMNGGGADVLLGSCETVDADCTALVEAAGAAESLLARMADDGVAHVVYVFYPDPQNADDVRQRIDALRPLIQSVCESSPVPCHWLDLRPPFAEHYDEYIQSGGLNPTPAGAQATAREIWALMQRECIAQ